jgi:hypothetical protein
VELAGSFTQRRPDWQEPSLLVRAAGGQWGEWWTDGVVVLSPSFNQQLGQFQAVEQLQVQQSITKLAAEAFVILVLPRSSLFYEARRVTNLAICWLIGPLSQR